ncbi:MAG TPA: TetR family transcriptional regulator [Acidimicrobiales bacterium]|nr:TetR family transcriptional regulator [Acidimicrobiales bacterium]
MSTVADLPADELAEHAPGRRDRKKLATRRALRLAALDLVAARGLVHVTVEDIAEAADVSTRTFFNYFPTKEAAVLGDEPGKAERMHDRLLARPPEETPLEALRAVAAEELDAFAAEVDELGEGQETWLRRFRLVREEPHLRAAHSARSFATERACAQALAERLGVDADRDPFPALVAAAGIAASRVAVFYWAASGGSSPLPRLLDDAFDSLAAGLPTPCRRTRAPRRAAGAEPDGPARRASTTRRAIR